MKNPFNRRQRTNMFETSVYDAQAQKTIQPFVFEGLDAGWTTQDYSVPKLFLQFYYVDFEKHATAMLDSIDEGIPHYFDQRIHNVVEEALAELLHRKAAHGESIADIIGRKKVTLRCHERELDELMAEEQKIAALVAEIGGYAYE